MKRALPVLVFGALVAGAVMLGLQWGASSCVLNRSEDARPASTTSATQPVPSRGGEDKPGEALLITQLTGVTQTDETPDPMESPIPAGMSGPEKIAAWLSSSTDIPTLADNLLAGIPSLEAKDHLLAVSKLAPLVSDDRFVAFQRLLLNPSTSTDAKEFLFRDALSRAETLKLPLLLELMQMPDHPCAAEARATLKMQLGSDYGTNYGQWQAKINEVLKGG